MQRNAKKGLTQRDTFQLSANVSMHNTFMNPLSQNFIHLYQSSYDTKNVRRTTRCLSIHTLSSALYMPSDQHKTSRNVMVSLPNKYFMTCVQCTRRAVNCMTKLIFAIHYSPHSLGIPSCRSNFNC